MPKAPTKKEKLASFLYILPSPVSERIFKDPIFLLENDFHSGKVLTIDGKISFDSLLFAQKVSLLLTQKKTQEIETTKGEKTKLQIENGKVNISWKEKDKPQENLDFSLGGLLSPVKKIRLESFEKLTHQFFSYIPKLEYWKTKITDKPLTPLEFINIIDDIDSSPITVWKEIERNLSFYGGKKRSEIPVDFLCPPDETYLNAITGFFPSQEKETFKENSFPAWAASLIKNNLVTALVLLLPLNLSDDFSPVKFVGKLPRTKLEKIFPKFLGTVDPVSLFSLLEISLFYMGKSKFFKDQVSIILPKLLDAENLGQNEFKINENFDVLVRYCSSCLREAPELRKRPIFWRRMAAWAHAAHLNAVLSRGNIKDKEIRAFLHGTPFKFEPLSSLIDFVQAPLSRDHLVESVDVFSFLRGRILGLLLDGKLDGLEEKLVNKVKDICIPEKQKIDFKNYSILRCSPIDQDTPPPTPLGKKLPPWKIGDLKGFFENLEDPNIWFSIYQCAEINLLDEPSLKAVVEKSKDLSSIEILESNKSKMFESGTLLIFIARILENEQIARNALKIMIKLSKHQFTDFEFQNLVSFPIALKPAFKDNKEFNETLKNFFFNISFFIQNKNQIDLLKNTFERFSMLIPEEAFIFGQAELLLRSM